MTTVIVHPLVLLSAVDHYNRVAKVSFRFVIIRMVRHFISWRHGDSESRTEEAADNNPDDPSKQAAFLSEIVESSPAEVIKRFESGRYAANDSCARSYLRALVLLDLLDKRPLDYSGLLKHMRSGDGRFGSNDAHGGTASGLLNVLGNNYNNNSGYNNSNGGSGSHNSPLHVVMQEPGFRSQLWRTLRTLTVALLVLSAISAAMEERGFMRGLTGVSEVEPQTDVHESFDSVQGVDEAKEELEEIVSFLRSPEKFSKLGGKLPKGVLLTGPPGTGKTLLARAIAGEAGVPFFYCSGSEFDEMFVGVGARRVRDLFAAAKRKSPCIIFIDEIDAIGSTRNPKDQQYVKMTLNQLLVELDGFKANDNVIVIGATNFPESLDKALVRPGRFDRHVVVELPDVRGRKAILDVHMKNVTLSPDADLSIVARGTPGFSGAELANLVNQAAVRASSEGQLEVGMAELDYAKDKIMMGAERKSAVIEEENRRLVAFHEGGHALVALYTKGAMPIHKATIVPRGRALGMVAQLPENDGLSWSRQQLLARLDVAMGGRVAEELVFGEDHITSGAQSDITQATALAHAMVTKYGMSSKVGLVLHRDEDIMSLSPETRSVIDQEVKALVTAAYERAKKILKSHDVEHRKLAEALLQFETLSAEEIRLVIKGKALLGREGA